VAVTIITDDLVQPTGEISDAMFPLGNMRDMADGWLLDAANQVANVSATEQNEAAKAWVYYRYNTYLSDRLAYTPNNMVAGPRTEGYSSDQRKYFADRAIYWLEIYYSLNRTVPQAAIPAFFGTVKARGTTWPWI